MINYKLQAKLESITWKNPDLTNGRFGTEVAYLIWDKHEEALNVHTQAMTAFGEKLGRAGIQLNEGNKDDAKDIIFEAMQELRQAGSHLDVPEIRDTVTNFMFEKGESSIYVDDFEYLFEQYLMYYKEHSEAIDRKIAEEMVNVDKVLTSDEFFERFVQVNTDIAQGPAVDIISKYLEQERTIQVLVDVLGEPVETFSVE